MITFGAGILLVVLALRLHFVSRYSNAPVDANVPAGAEYGLLYVCVATFASTILTFLIGALCSSTTSLQGRRPGEGTA